MKIFSHLPVYPIFLLAALAATLGYFTTAYMGIASFAYGLMILGLRFRKQNRFTHRKLMYSAMALDVGLVLLLEVQREAIGTVIALDLAPLQLAHVLFSTLAVILYFPLVILGTKLWKREMPALRLWHRNLGFTAFALRSLGFVLMFSLLSRAHHS